MPPRGTWRLPVLIIAGDPLTRAGLRAMLEADPGIDVVEAAREDHELADEASDGGRGGALVVVRDLLDFDAAVGLDLPGSADAPRSTAERPVVALVPDARMAREALAAGARAVLLRDALAAGALSAAVHAANEGLLVIDRELERSLLVTGPRSLEPDDRNTPGLFDVGHATAPTAAGGTPLELVDPLTPRELEVLALLAEGLSNRRIAAVLGMSEHTAKFHVNSILGKLGAATRTEAVVRATRLGLIAL